MLGAGATNAALLALGCLYPAYLTFKTLEHDRKSLASARGWCIFWTVNACWLASARALDIVCDARVVLYRECKVRARAVDRVCDACVSRANATDACVRAS